jgi:hypothetical protein
MEPYKYETLNQDRKEIRIFRQVADLPDENIALEMKTISILQPGHQAFTTISYVWGDPRMEIPIVISGQQLLITRSVHELLYVLLRMDEFDGPVASCDMRATWWWLDSISINQQDLADRASQVQIMGEIYKKSSLTIAYTGPSYDESDLAMRRIRRSLAHETDPIRVRVSQKEANDMETAFFKFHSRPLFSRAWILQEWILPKQLMVLTGTTFLLGEFLETAITRSPLAISKQLGDRVHLRNIYHSVSFVPFFRVMVAISRLDATDSRDIIYAILGLIRDASHVVSRPDYTACVTQVYSSVIYRYAKKYGRLDIMCLNQWQKTRSNLPSWVPDLHTAVHLQSHTMAVDNIHIIESVSLSTTQSANVEPCATSSSTQYNERCQAPPSFGQEIEINRAILRDCKIPWGYRADGGSVASVSISNDLRLLTVSGIWLAPVASLGAHLIYEYQTAEVQGRLPRYIPAGTLPLDQPFDLPCPYESDEHIRHAFVRTIRLCPCSLKRCNPHACFCQWNKKIGHSPCDEGETDIFTEYVQALDGSHCLGKNVHSFGDWLAKWWSLNKAFRVGSKTLEELFVAAPRPTPRVRPRGSMMRFEHVIAKMNRRLIVNKWGALGMVPYEARIRDLV